VLLHGAFGTMRKGAMTSKTKTGPALPGEKLRSTIISRTCPAAAPSMKIENATIAASNHSWPWLPASRPSTP
jgi:hypothetical protein